MKKRVLGAGYWVLVKSNLPFPGTRHLTPKTLSD